MRLAALLLALPLGVAPAAAQTASVPQPDAAATPHQAEPAATPQQQAQVQAPHHRLSWEQRFAQANATHDGRLTLEQAHGGYKTVARHFDEIDADRKGYVTLEDIRTWHRLQRTARHKDAPKEDDSLQPRPAYHRHPAQHTLMDNAAGHTAAGPALPRGEPPPPPEGLDVKIDPNAPS